MNPMNPFLCNAVDTHKNKVYRRKRKRERKEEELEEGTGSKRRRKTSMHDTLQNVYTLLDEYTISIVSLKRVMVTLSHG